MMSLLFNMLPRPGIISFQAKCVCFVLLFFFSLITWLNSLSVVILEPKKIKSATVSTVSPSISHEVMGPDAIPKSEDHFWGFSRFGILNASG